jgi:hypothetical protein
MRAPALFVIGVYLGLVFFGEKDRVESRTFQIMRAQFRGTTTEEGEEEPKE